MIPKKRRTQSKLPYEYQRVVLRHPASLARSKKKLENTKPSKTLKRTFSEANIDDSFDIDDLLDDVLDDQLQIPFEPEHIDEIEEATEEHDDYDFEEYQNNPSRFESNETVDHYSTSRQHREKEFSFSNYESPYKRQKKNDFVTAAMIANERGIRLNETVKDTISVQEIHKDFRQIFSFNNFNPMQSKCFKEIYCSDINMVITAPTGAGKTVLFELAIIRLMQKHLKGGTLSSRPAGKHKVVYMAPIKALCQEKTNEWKTKFTKLGIQCIELTGDTEVNITDISNIDIIITTPEKWDSMTRRWRDRGMMNFIGQIELFLIDEVHILNEERGPVLEAVISRMKTVKTSADMHGKPSANLRFVAVSATIPNIEDIGEWLNVPPEGIKLFGDEYRPVQLEIKVIGYKNNSKNPFLFNRNLNYKLLQVIDNYSEQKPTLIFCSTRKETSQAAVQVAKDAGPNKFIVSAEQLQRLRDASKQVSDRTLKECLLKGIGFHSAGMSYNDRRIIENLFLNSDIRVICTTSTLAQGVNFPAHLVIIKGTMQYKSGIGYCEYDELSIRQMIGRAGRPQFDESGAAVIMTDQSTVALYENIIHRKQAIESHLHERMIEHLNAEIVLGTITDVSVAIQWLKSTFLYIRMQKNPKLYNLPSNISKEKLEASLKDLCLKQLHLLKGQGLIVMDDSFRLSPTDLGRTMARYYVEFATMELLSSIGGMSTMGSLIEVLSKAKEFSEFRIRMGEKKILNAINSNKEKMKYPFKGKVKTVSDKVYCLIQAELGDIPFDNWTLKQQSIAIFHSAPRVSRCMADYLIGKKYYQAYKNALILTKCLQQKMWDDSQNVLKQLDGIGNVYCAALAKSGITSFSKLEETNPGLIERILNKRHPFGSKLLAAVSNIPRWSLTVQQFPNEDKQVTIHILAEKKNNSIGTQNKRKPNYFVLLVGNANNEIIAQRRFRTDISKKFDFKVMVDNDPKNHEIQISLINEEFIGVDSFEVVKIPQFKRTSRDPQTGSGHKSKMKPGRTQKKLQTPRSSITIGGCNHKCKDKTKCKHVCCKNNYQIEFDLDIDDDLDSLLDEDLLEPKKNKKTVISKNNKNPLSVPTKPEHEFQTFERMSQFSDDFIQLDPSFFDLGDLDESLKTDNEFQPIDWNNLDQFLDS